MPDAEPLFKRALAILEKARGPNHPNVASSLNNLALLYQAQGRYADAEPLLKRSFAIGAGAAAGEARASPRSARPLGHGSARRRSRGVASRTTRTSSRWVPRRGRRACGHWRRQAFGSRSSPRARGRRSSRASAARCRRRCAARERAGRRSARRFPTARRRSARPSTRRRARSRGAGRTPWGGRASWGTAPRSVRSRISATRILKPDASADSDRVLQLLQDGWRDLLRDGRVQRVHEQDVARRVTVGARRRSRVGEPERERREDGETERQTSAHSGQGRAGRPVDFGVRRTQAPTGSTSPDGSRASRSAVPRSRLYRPDGRPRTGATTRSGSRRTSGSNRSRTCCGTAPSLGDRARRASRATGGGHGRASRGAL